MKELKLPINELDFSFARASGAGGQNVNKVNSKVTLRWHVKKTASFSSDVIQRFVKKYAGKISQEGILLLTSQKYRTQPRNIADCLEKLKSMLQSVLLPPKVRRAGAPTKASVEHRLKSKKRNSEVKRSRHKDFDY